MANLRAFAASCGLICCAWNRCLPDDGPPIDHEGGAAGEGAQNQAGEPAGGAGTGGAGTSVGGAGAGAGGAGGVAEGGTSVMAGAGGEGGAPPPAGARVTVLDWRGVPTADAAVVFYDARGESPSIVRTGADGVASHVVEAGAPINVAIHLEPADPYGLGYNYDFYQFVTVFDVQPGDDLLVRNELNLSPSFPRPPSSGGGTVSVSFPELPSSYYVADSCGSGYADHSPMQVSFSPDCVDAAGNVSFTMSALSAEDQPVGYKRFEGLALPTSGGVSFDAWDPVGSYEVPFSNPPPNVRLTQVRTTHYRDGVALGSGNHYRLAPVPSVLVTHPRALTYDAADLLVELRYLPDASGTWEPSSSRLTREPADRARLVDLSQLRPPLYDPVLSSDVGGLFRASWQADSSLGRADGAVVKLDGSRYADLPTGGANVEEFYYTLVGPGDSTELVPPPLPPELVPPRLAPSELIVRWLSVIDSTELESYSEFRHEFGRSFGYYGDLPPPTTPDSVTFRATIQQN